MPFKLVIALLTSQLLWACSNTASDATQDYVQRLSNVLEREPIKAEPLQVEPIQVEPIQVEPIQVEPKLKSAPSRLNFPRPRELTIDTAENILSVREFLSFRQCRLHSAVADKNSLLGKFAEPSQALFMDLTILAFGPQCVTQLQNDGQVSLASKLGLMLEQKEKMLRSSLWSALLGSSESADFWSINPQAVDYPINVNNDSVVAIHRLTEFANQVLRGGYQVSAVQQSEIENSLAKLRYGEGGTLLGYIDSLASQLSIADNLVKQRLKSPLCLTASPTPSARYLQNIVQKYFIPKVQKQAVLLNQRYQQVLPAYRKLEATLQEVEPAAYKNWRQARDQRAITGLAATKSHVLLLQQLYQQCGLQPGASARD